MITSIWAPVPPLSDFPELDELDRHRARRELAELLETLACECPAVALAHPAWQSAEELSTREVETLTSTLETAYWAALDSTDTAA